MAKLTDMLGRPHSGLVPWVVSAIVTDNVDPDEYGRIQVKFPTLNEEPLSFWLRQSSPNAGVERGLYALPEVDDEVLVVFMQGSQDVGVIIGQFWNGVDLPPQECKDAMPGAGKTDSGAGWAKSKFTEGSTSLDTNDRRFWKSRSGHLLVFDDTDGSESVQIWNGKHELCLAFDTAESLITLSNTKGDIMIRAKNDVMIEAGNDFKWKAGNNFESECAMDSKHKIGMNWKTDAGQNEEHKSGMDTKIEAGMNFTGKASMAWKMEGSMTYEAKGGMTAKIEGSAMCTVKGGMVMIN